MSAGKSTPPPPPAAGPSGWVAVVIAVGVVAAVAGSVATWVTGRREVFMTVAAVGFALQLAGWMAHGRRQGGES